MVKRATLLAKGDFITLQELSDEIKLQPKNEMTQSESFILHNEEIEKQRIINALQQAGHNKTKAAQLLGIDRKTLYNKLKLYNIG